MVVSTFWRCVLAILATLVTADLVEGASYAKQCPLSNSDVVDIVYDPVTGEYVVVEDSPKDGGRGRRRRGLRGRDSNDQDNNDNPKLVPAALNLLSLKHREAREQSATSTILLQARSCPCAVPGTYCLLKNGQAQNTCGVPRDSRHPIGCYNLSTKMVFIRNAWPVVVLWYGALVIFLIATDNGRSARNWVLSKICRGRNERMADRILTREVQIRDRLREARVVGNRRSRLAFLASGGMDHEGDTSGVTTQTLVLKTKRFNAKREREKRKRLRAARKKDASKQQSDAFYDEGEGGVTSMTSASTSFGDTDGDLSALASSMTQESHDAVPTTPERAKSSSTKDDTPDTSPDSVHSAMSYPPCAPSPLVANSLSDDEAIEQTLSADTLCSPCNVDQGPDGHENRAEASDDDNDGDEFTCTICIMEVEDGEKVGVLPNCNHIFHVSCLKEWIKRRNVCPLCQSPEIASPRPSTTDPGESAQSSDLPNSPSGDSSVGINANGARPAVREGARRLSQSSNDMLQQQRMRRANDPVLQSLRSRLFVSGEQMQAQSSNRRGDSSGRTRVMSPQRALPSRQSADEVENRTLVMSGSAEDADFHRRRRRARASARSYRAATTT